MLHTETFGHGPNLCLLHGWAAQNAHWREWAQQYLAPHFTVTLIELPGFGDSKPLHLNSPPPLELETAWLKAIHAVLPQKTYLLGWSLGGLLAQKIALAYPQQINKLICLASTPRFTQNDQWQYGVSPKLMADFMSAITQETLQTLNTFWKLQLQGSENARQHIKQFFALLKTCKLPSLTGLKQGLILLKEIDCRDDLANLKMPTLWLQGEKDPLIPAPFITEMLSKNSTIPPNMQITILPKSGHMPFRSHPAETAQSIIDFLSQK
ncbi:Pimeloyl-[acyl-carrier protein] methyl ester esterase BioH [hydrothermal vent metagenome]|uniref:Pimeloyl-[acyl-carrier protein] methyl ester esterase BioH n=1 Tax=hydrothermal vent metagenome TaxID=652676 RepID=A0A3B0WD77_9ZZZZ